MNRLIIIGNGFDLAHGLPTSYNDFFLGYTKNLLINSIEINSGGDENIMVSTGVPNRFKTKIIEADSLKMLTNILKSNIGIHKKQNLGVFKNELLKNLIDKSNLQSWVDIEKEYYAQLSKLAYSLSEGRQAPISKLPKLNTEMTNLSIALKQYIKDVCDEHKFEEIPPILNIFNSNLIEDVKQPQSTLFLNFNYSRTLENYVSKINKSHEIQIHGCVDDINNPIIFGYGDEGDKLYKGFEEINNNGFFKHFKTFKYLETDNYQNMIKFVESDEYEVFTIGHSCGLSDRTLLKYLFENKNCKRIKLYYYPDKQAYINLTYEVSRYFDDKQTMREKVVSFEKSEPCPQVQLNK